MYFKHGKIKEVIEVTFSDHFHDNIIKKGYLVFDADELLNIKDSITRSIYTMITKWRNNKLYLKRPAFYIARRVPLAWTKHSIKKTVPRIEKSLLELKELNYISDYNLHKNDKLEKAEFEIFFSDEHNKIKRDIFYDEKAEFNKMIHYEEVRLNEEIPLLESNNNENEVNLILSIFGEKGAKLKTLPSAIREALKNYEFDYVKYTAEYTTLNCKVSYIKYFKDALENNWAAEYIIKKEIREEKKEKKKKVIEEAVLIEDTVNKKLNITWEEFESFEEKIKIKIEEQAYKEYLTEIGSNDNKIIKGIYEKSKKSHILKICNTNEKFKKIEQINPNNHLIVENTKIQENEENNVRESSNKIISEKFISVSMFMVRVVTYLNSSDLNIDPQSFMLVFSHLKEYEDDKIFIKYNEDTKIGEIIIKL